MNYDDWKQQTPPTGKPISFEKEKPKAVNEKYEEYMRIVREKPTKKR